MAGGADYVLAEAIRQWFAAVGQRRLEENVRNLAACDDNYYCNRLLGLA